MRIWSKAVLALVVIAAALPALASMRWQSGFGQGVAEAFIEPSPGEKIYVACEAGFGQPVTGITFTIDGQQPLGNSEVRLRFDGGAPMSVSTDADGVIESDCRVCAAWFDTVRDALKKHSSVNVEFSTGAQFTFPLAGSAEAIGDCPADFGKTF